MTFGKGALGCSGHLAARRVWRGRIERERGGAGWGTGWLGINAQPERG